MQVIPIYRYTRPGGGVTVSPTRPEGECVEMVRLAADEGMLLRLPDGTTVGCIDTDDVGLADAVTEEVDPEWERMKKEMEDHGET